MLKFISCELDPIPTIFRDKKILTYEIELPQAGKKIGLNLLDDKYFKIIDIIDRIPNWPACGKTFNTG